MGSEPPEPRGGHPRERRGRAAGQQRGGFEAQWEAGHASGGVDASVDRLELTARQPGLDLALGQPGGEQLASGDAAVLGGE